MRIGEMRYLEKGGNIIRVVRTEDDVLKKKDGSDITVYRLVYYLDIKGLGSGIVIICVTKDVKEMYIFPKNEYDHADIVVKLDNSKVKNIDDVVNKSIDLIMKYHLNRNVTGIVHEDEGIIDSFLMGAFGVSKEQVLLLKIYFGIVGAISGISLAIYLYKLAVKKKVEGETKYAEWRMEGKLFGGEKLKDEVIRKWYGDLIDGIRLLAKGKRNFLIVTGPPGTGKSHVVRRELYLLNKVYGIKYIFIKGTSLSLPSFISTLYNYNKNYIIAIDDFDVAINDPDYISILKSAADSYENRVIELRQEHRMEYQQGALESGYAFPEKFVFKSRIIVITNRKAYELDPALISRSGGVINVEFSPEDSIQLLKDILPKIEPSMPLKDKEEIYEYIKEAYKKYNVEPNVRLLRLLIDARLGSGNKWRSVADDIMKSFAMRGTKRAE
ncbi:MAG: AAA family ATPase [Candidatus Anstonellales archaeon]